MQCYNGDRIKFHEKVSVCTLCAAEFNNIRKDQAMRGTKISTILAIIICMTTLSNAAPMGTAFTYQGRLIDDNVAADGLYDFEFKLFYDPCTGTQQGSTIEVSDLDVIDGYFKTELDFGSVFDGDALWLDIGVRPGDTAESFTTLTPRQQITSAPYASYAGYAAYAKNTDKYAQVVTVALSGGDYTSVQAAIDSITDAADDNPYLLWIAPGVYNESVTMKPYVHLQGAGQEATIITSSVSSGIFPPTYGTIILSHHTSLRDLTVVNNGTGSYPTALLATAGTTEVLISDITVKAHGQSTCNFAIFIGGIDTNVTLQDVTALSENGSGYNYGLRNDPCAIVSLRSGIFKASGGNNTYAIYNNGSEMVAESVTALAENGSSSNHGLLNSSGANATFFGGTFCGRGGTSAYGIYNQNINTTLEANNINALGENGSSGNHGFINSSGANAKLNGGTFTARGGPATIGIRNTENTTLEANNINVLGENGSSINYGIMNSHGADAKLNGGTFTARGALAYGIRNSDNNPTLEANNIHLVAENGSSNYGLYNYDGISDVTQSVLESPTYSAYNQSGTLVISNSRLVGGPCAGTVTCVAVSRGTTFNSSGCP